MLAKAGLLLRKRIATKSPISILEPPRLNPYVPQLSLHAHLTDITAALAARTRQSKKLFYRSRIIRTARPLASPQTMQ